MIKCIGKISIFKHWSSKFLTCSVDLNMGFICGTTRIKTIFNSSPGVGMHFIGNTHCSHDDTVMQLFHILCFFTINSLFYKPPEEKIRGVKPGEWAVRGQGMGPPLSI
jgi:hypothetical protein